ncbi:DUF4838 domain-containing protein [Cohnella sp. LGH]|uniref:DUF4838 domain-containing protein n=1 Tax=Cohnella sp. LGH TaxID=1619153 RepID=UPI001AD958AB|nr:DUF4838 domain-containing protein [Cohnella sp. LGH]QTH43149.1 DUF4838 domain-containing protein [Cohnella sp. LGH]
MHLQAPVLIRYGCDSDLFSLDSPILAFARQQLDIYIERIFDSEAEPGRRLDVIFTSRTDAELRHDGYSVTIGANEVTIASAMERGILYGVYEWLRMLGCRFTFPAARLEIVPQIKSIELEEQTVRKSPWLEFRGLCLYDTTGETLGQTIDRVDWMAKNNYNLLLTSIHRTDDSVDGMHAILWDEVGDKLLPELRKRGIAIDMSEHSTDYFFPREHWFALHPEWFSFIDGKRVPRQICYSNPDAVREYASSFAAFARENHYFQLLGIWPLDGAGYCECDRCRDPLTLLRANFYIADEIRRIRPDLLVEHLAYTPQSFARPREELPSNMSVLVCNVNDQVAYEWGVVAKNGGGAFYFDYHTGDHYRFRSNLWINPFYVREMVNTFAAYDYRGIVSLYLPIASWWQASLNYYYLSRFYYEPTASVEELTAELSADLFGARNRSSMTKVLMEIFRQLQDQTLWSGMPHKHSYYSEHISARNRELDRLHLEKMEITLRRIETWINEADYEGASPSEQTQLDYVREYVRLQRLYFCCIDQYDADIDRPERAEPYFHALGELEQRYGSVFISENYARWRIIGRDNIFDPLNVNSFQPRTS